MHSSRMRTGRSLTIYRSLLLGGCLLWEEGEGGVCSGGGCLLPGGVCSWGVSALEGVCSWGCLLWGVCSQGMSAPGGCLLWGCLLQGVCVCSGGGVGGIPACTEADTPSVNRMTDRCKNITLATTSLRPVNILIRLLASNFYNGVLIFSF